MNDGPQEIVKKVKMGIVGFIAFMILILIFARELFGPILISIPYLILVIIVLYAFVTIFVKKYGETERGIIYRFGAFNRMVGPGWAIVLPFIEKEFKKVDIRVHTENLENITAVTRDDIPLTVNVSYFYAISDPIKAVLRVRDIEKTVVNYVHGAVRDGVGEFLMREVFSRIEDINNHLRKRLGFISEEWGLDVKNIEILKVILPNTVLTALMQPITAEQKAIAARFAAEAKRVIIEVLGDAAERLNPNALTYLYLRALEKIARGRGSKIVLPMTFPTLESGVAAGIGLSLGLTKGDVEKVVDKIAKKITS